MTTACRPTASARRIRVLVLASTELLRKGVRATLSGRQDLALAVESSADRESLTWARQPPPDVVLAGADPSRPDGLEVVRRAAQLFVGVPVLMLALDASLESFLAAVRAGAKSYILLSTGGTALAEAIRATAGGGSVIDPVVARRLLEHVTSVPQSGGWPHRSLPDGSVFTSLTNREAQVLRLLAQGMSNSEIASALCIRLGTVKTHIRHILPTLGVRDRTGAAIAALRVPALQELLLCAGGTQKSGVIEAMEHTRRLAQHRVSGNENGRRAQYLRALPRITGEINY